ncbi:MAG: class I SAM-dependent methyltransferase [Chloroflexi bacterium]|jgi:O-methyltransferase involved in polyketide biosynthesis|nr:class I SAM-dependent methyltransferase [Chloroflexota bacterium]
METKEKITLTKEQETLLIPLYAKAQRNPILEDEKARQILAQVQYDFQRLNVPEKTAVTLRMRAKQLDAYATAFLAAHPEAVVLHLGCGLDSRCLRVMHARALWIDLDLPDVIALRRKFYPETESYRLVASSAADLDWIDQVDDQGRPVLVIAEGLLMYLHEEEVRALILRLHARFPGCHLAFDAFSQLTAERIQAHPSMQKTGASVHWGIDDPHAIEDWAEGIHLQEEWFFAQSPDIPRLSWFYRLMFRLTASIQVAQRAQRLLYFTL